VTKPEWTQKTYSLAYLRSKETFGTFRSVFPWLKGIGIVPLDVSSMRDAQVKLALDDKNIEAGYLAASAYEWDSWGASRPSEFLDALDLETAGTTRKDVIVETLTMLGRAGAEEPLAIEHSLRLPVPA
jgi:hypothetical protein